MTNVSTVTDPSPISASSRSALTLPFIELLRACEVTEGELRRIFAHPNAQTSSKHFTKFYSVVKKVQQFKAVLRTDDDSCLRDEVDPAAVEDVSAPSHPEDAQNLGESLAAAEKPSKKVSHQAKAASKNDNHDEQRVKPSKKEKQAPESSSKRTRELDPCSSMEEYLHYLSECTDSETEHIFPPRGYGELKGRKFGITSMCAENQERVREKHTKEFS